MRPENEPPLELGDDKVYQSGRIQLLIYTRDRIPTLNRERKEHWSWKDNMKTDWKAATHAALDEAKYRPRHGLEAARFQFQPWLPPKKWGTPFDTSAGYPAEKAIIDALVEAEVIPDDTREHNRGQLTLPPEDYLGMRWPVMQVDIWPWPLPDYHPADLCDCREKYQQKQIKQELAKLAKESNR